MYEELCQGGIGYVLEKDMTLRGWLGTGIGFPRAMVVAPILPKVKRFRKISKVGFEFWMVACRTRS